MGGRAQLIDLIYTGKQQQAAAFKRAGEASDGAAASSEPAQGWERGRREGTRQVTLPDTVTATRTLFWQLG